MTKKDLKTGDIGTLRDGSEYSVILGFYREGGILFRHGDWDSLSFYSDNLTHEECEEYDIVKVRHMKNPGNIGFPERDKDGDVIYIREEPKELTVKEIEELLGYPVKVVK